MADFCMQCSLELFQIDFGDLAGMSTREDTYKGLFCFALCEGCGPIQVDHEGRCVSPDCTEFHGAVATEVDAAAGGSAAVGEVVQSGPA